MYETGFNQYTCLIKHTGSCLSPCFNSSILRGGYSANAQIQLHPQIVPNPQVAEGLLLKLASCLLTPS